MLKTTKTTNISGQVFVEVTKESGIVNEQVAYLNATIHEDGNININKSIQNKELFTQNKEAVLADIKTFEDSVYGL